MHSLLLMALAVTPAAAADRTAEQEQALTDAKELVPEGQALFIRGDYAEALEQFRAAEQILEGAELETPPSLDRILGRCYDQLGQVVPALRYLKRFIARAQADDPETAEALRRAEQAVDRLQAQLDRTTLSFDVEPDGAEVRIGPQALGRTPLEPVQVAPGPAQVTLFKDGYEPQSVDVQVVAGMSVPIVVRLAPIAATPPRAEASGISWWLVGGAAATAVTVAAVTVAVLAGDDSSGATTPAPAPIPFRSVP